MKTVYKEGTKLLDYRQIEAFQGELKDLPDNEYQKLLASFNEHGFFIPEFIWEHEGHNYCIDGHGRQRVLNKEQIEFENTGFEIPVVYIEADSIRDAKEKLLKVTSQYQKISQDGLNTYIVEAELPQAEIYQAVSFDALPLLGVSTEVPEVEEDDVPEVNEGGDASSVLGTVYQLGRHRLMCGDSTDFSSITDLLDGVKVDLVFSDPPYGINIVTEKHQVGADFGIASKGKFKPVIGDESIKTAQDFYNNCIELDMDRFILWGGNYFTQFLPFSDSWLIWDKRGDSGIRNSFADAEMAWCSFHTPIRLYTQLWNGMIREGEHEKRIHPTQKPLRTLVNIIKDFTKEDGVIYDGFLGSGSTLIACEESNRLCLGVELSPYYCDVIRKRYWKHINKDEPGEVLSRWEEGTPAIGDTNG